MRCSFWLSLILLCAGAAEGSCANEVASAVSNELSVLRVQVESLVSELVAVRLEADGLRARLAGREFRGYASVMLRPAQIEADDAAAPHIIEVSEELRLVVLDKGARRGVRPGMRFAVLRADKVVGEIETVDVRDGIAGAVVVSAEQGGLPETGDRLTEIAGLKK
ncbi:MAG: hypothetical protein WCL44_06145 [bacterium]